MRRVRGVHGAWRTRGRARSPSGRLRRRPRRHPSVDPLNGPGGGAFADDCAADPEGVRAATAHRPETLELSSEPLFVGKARNIMRIYLSPLDRALGGSALPRTSGNDNAADSSGRRRAYGRGDVVAGAGFEPATFRL